MSHGLIHDWTQEVGAELEQKVVEVQAEMFEHGVLPEVKPAPDTLWVSVDGTLVHDRDRQNMEIKAAWSGARWRPSPKAAPRSSTAPSTPVSKAQPCSLSSAPLAPSPRRLPRSPGLPGRRWSGLDQSLLGALPSPRRLPARLVPPGREPALWARSPASPPGPRPRARPRRSCLRPDPITGARRPSPRGPRPDSPLPKAGRLCVCQPRRHQELSPSPTCQLWSDVERDRHPGQPPAHVSRHELTPPGRHHMVRLRLLRLQQPMGRVLEPAPPGSAPGVANCRVISTDD
jgi:hypothetical protein